MRQIVKLEMKITELKSANAVQVAKYKRLEESCAILDSQCQKMYDRIEYQTDLIQKEINKQGNLHSGLCNIHNLFCWYNEE